MSEIETLKQRLAQMSIVPEKAGGHFEQWIDQKDFIQFLAKSKTDEIPLYVSFGHTYIYSVFLPSSALKGDYVKDLMEWSVCADSTWGYGYSMGKGGRVKLVKIFPPLDSPGSKLLQSASPIVFLRSFEGKQRGRRSYVEANQLLTHLHGLHWDDASSAYCRLNAEGDIDRALKIYIWDDGILVTIKKDIVDFHQFLTKSVMVRLFDRMVSQDWKRFGGWNNPERSSHEDKPNEIYWKQGKDREKTVDFHASFIRGFQILRNVRPRREMVARLEGKSLERKKYEKFIAVDWKHDKVGEFSCDPEKLGNYFVQSDKPFGTSPVFFKPDVLARYKADPDKYTVSERQIHCRGAWGLETYDINKAGQVHSYLVYLGRLPYSEQQYWKSFNDKPKDGISKRAYKSDFAAEWDLDYNPLQSLKDSLRKLQERRAELWQCPDDNIYERLNYPVTGSEKEWVDEVHNADKLVVEGFRYAYLKDAATKLGCFDEKHGSIKLIQAVLSAQGVSEEEVEGIILPLNEVHKLRSKFSGHRAGDEAAKIKKELVKKHGELKAHFKDLLTRVDKSIQSLLILKF